MAMQNEEGQTGLYVAAAGNQEEVFRYLVKFCDFETAATKSNVGTTALHAAAKNGHIGEDRLFCAASRLTLVLWPELCRICDPTDTSPLYVAAAAKHYEIVKAILDVDRSCIRIVRKMGKRQLLLADLSILNARDKKGNTALHIATRKWRSENIHLLVSYPSIEVNALNNQKETAMDLAEKLSYEHVLEIRETLLEAGAKHAIEKGGQDLKQDLHSQLRQNEKTNKRVSGIAKELQKLHREAVQNTINSVTVVAVLTASIAFMAIFNLPGQYESDGEDVGKANVADSMGFRVFCLLDATALFISLAVVVVQITLVAWETGAQKQVVAVVNKLMWAASFLDVGPVAPWMAITITVIGGPMIVGTLGVMCFLVFRRYFKLNDDSQRIIRRTSGSRSFSWSRYSAFSDPEANYSDHEKSFYAL
ncbi:unnamed protein product [Spirodela intermedia]|uniref:PGG domain-containing protein n=1 Tax=Spirodela intermedia TaxID=51605 RepID=A0A7I8J420_SPIIN|nr:unnamed protein product [Spirodela intermedia]CAA6664784.1 unnamed protein product [Spirodela intermedia]